MNRSTDKSNQALQIDTEWWKSSVIYQIYPRSFMDTDNDGTGDIQGIIQKLDYLEWLGADALWLSPINESPMHDFGYDISDYRAIDTLFGSLTDFEKLISEAHKRKIRIIMDLVINHTSHMHPWFHDSRMSRRSAKRDWYIWRDDKNGKPPNNWVSVFGGSAWQWDETTNQYYLHSFLEEQPDLNWRNPAVKKAVFNDIKFWLDRDVDGFRLDVVNWFVKDRRFRSNPSFFGIHTLQSHIFDRNRPETHEILKELRELVDGYKDRLLVGEVFSLPPGNPKLSASFLGNGRNELHLAFDFSLIYRPWNARLYYRTLRNWMRAIPADGWPCNVLSNHDQFRSMSRFGTGKEALMRAKVAATLLLTMKGTPFIYYGEEIGMRDYSIPRDMIRDPLGKRFWPFYAGRDRARTPMQWDSSPSAGFTESKPWLPVHLDYESVNVKKQKSNSDSLLSFYRNLIKLRRQNLALRNGTFEAIAKGRRGIIAYFRESDEDTICVITNFKEKKSRIHIRADKSWEVIFSTHRKCGKIISDLDLILHKYEASVFRQII